jgi:hypothetical protein
MTMSSLGWVCFGVWGLFNCLIAHRLLRRPSKSGTSEGSAVSSASADDALSQGNERASNGLKIRPLELAMAASEARIDLLDSSRRFGQLPHFLP